MRQLNENQIFQYNGSPITFHKRDSVMVNATQMAKSFGKEPKFWLMNQSTTDYLHELSKVRNLTLADLVQVTKGGNNPGTWMHEDVAMEFARWLSPAFAIWCNDRIKELLQYGVTATQPTLEQMINNPDLVISLATQLKSEREEKEKFRMVVEEQQKEITQVTPKVEFAECIMKSSDCISVGDMANILNQNNLFGKGKISFYRWLRYNGYLIQRGIRYNHPSQKSMKNNLMRLVEVPYTTRGMVAFNTISMITPYGQKYFINLFRKMKAGKSQPELLFEK